MGAEEEEEEMARRWERWVLRCETVTELEGG